MNTLHRIPKLKVERGRQNYVLDLCRGKRILHVGCVDKGYVEERMLNEQLMHLQLMKVADSVAGIDIDSEGVALLQAHGVDEVHVADLAQPFETLPMAGREFDVVVATEIVEHLSNPGLVLDNLRRYLAPGAQLVISVPNAFRLHTLVRLFRGVEFVHPDHNYWFSYYTISNLVRKHGFEIDDIRMYAALREARHREGAKGVMRALLMGIYRLLPSFADGVLLACRTSR